MNTEWVWWFLALLLAGGGVVAFLAFGRVPEIGDEAGEVDDVRLEGERAGAAVTETSARTSAGDPP
jgi:hypothetical protein